MALTFQIGDLVRFAPHPAPILGLPEIGLVMECRELTHESRGYKYEVVRVQFGDVDYTLPSSDFELVKRV
jgi:hypothetical protein